jgi:2-succinyl-5-enolpyruvyl-6-hydroxy-3-cyclohexene-1-carboxylate synthase
LAAWVTARDGRDSDGRPGDGAATDLPLGRRWGRADALLQRLLRQELEAPPAEACPSEPWLARRLATALPPGWPVMLANSSPVRDWESFVEPDAPWRPVFSFRGASGIDGTLSCAFGLAEGLGRLVLISGDLALLHDSNGWLWQRQLRGRLTVIVIDNQGGGIFEQLPIRTDPGEALDFERLFAMPPPLDPCALASAHGIPARRVGCRGDLDAALTWALARPIALVSVRTDRRADASLRQRLRTMAAGELNKSLALP